MSVMDVQIEPQIQLLSRLQLTVDSQSRLCFLHGDSGVGKSYVANLLADKINHYCIQLTHHTGRNTPPIKQQLICELAGEGFSDLEQPLLSAVQERIAHYSHAVLIIIDNASDLPQADIAMLWHAVHDFALATKNGPNFNVVLIGESRWATPLFKALDKKEQSLVAEFNLKVLTKAQAKDFLMAVHSEWSDGKIDSFLKRLKPQYLLPKQLIFASMETPEHKSNKRLLIGLGLTLLVFTLALLAASFIEQSPDGASSPVIDSAESVTVPTPLKTDANVSRLIDSNTVTENVIDEDAHLSQFNAVTTPIEQAVTLPSAQDTLEKVVNVAPDIVSKTEAQVMQQIVTPVIELPAIKEAVTPTVDYDESQLLSIPEAHYSLMLGGFSDRNTLTQVHDQLDSFSDIYQYVTIRNGKPWYVLLYGDYATRAAADDILLALPTHVSGFSPWPKPFTSIHQEIAAFASTTTDK